MQDKIIIVKRDSLPALTHVDVDDRKVDIGELRDFSRHDALRACMTSNASTTSFAWTTLKPGQTLAAHKHPVDSMILVCEGAGRYFGEYDAELGAGDIVYVRSNALHGFQAAADSRLECLSIQFEGRGLYEDSERSLVKFGNISHYDSILACNRNWKKSFAELCASLSADIHSHGDIYNASLYGYIGRWSGVFQNLLFLRQANTHCKSLSEIFREHLHDEFGHDELLSQYEYRWDAQLEAYFGWFLNQMYTRSDETKLILVHMVMETAGDVFSQVMAESSAGKTEIAEYVGVHGELDGGHADVGSDIIKQYCFSHSVDAMSACEDGWRMFMGMFTRMRELALLRQQEAMLPSEMDAA
jgi:mannose-6-phosphate isomerase-like protein (cupin superfamily)